MLMNSSMSTMLLIYRIVYAKTEYTFTHNGLCHNKIQQVRYRKMTDTISAAMLAIGDELLSGRTRDKNIGHLAAMLTAVGIDLKEVRIVADDQDEIVAALNALRVRYTYVFTSGGIGPTHDDITADTVSLAFGLPCEHDVKAMQLLGDSYASRGVEFNETRQRMARMPRGAAHIANKVSVAPGFIIGNVHVMAGVPSVFEAMLDEVIPSLKSGVKLLSVSIHCPFGEGVIGMPLGAIQKAHPETVIGSYPKMVDGGYMVDLIVRARNETKMNAAADAVRAMLISLESTANRVQPPAG
jgi:molybdenum cofactor synthesis domain-containing protein